MTTRRSKRLKALK